MATKLLRWVLVRLSICALGAVAALGCADDGATAQDATTLLGDCQRPSGAEVAHRVIFSERFRCSPPATPTEAVVTDATSWDVMAAEIANCSSPSTAADPVDFDTEYVVVLGTMAFQTCGFDDDGVTVLAGDGGPWVELAVTDRSAGCLAACASGGGYVVAVALPRSAGESPSLCRRVNPGCP